MNTKINCPIGEDVGDRHTFVAGSGRLAFVDIMGYYGSYWEICQECAHPMNEPVVDGGLELAPDLEIYSVWVGGLEVNDYYLNPRQAIELVNTYLVDGYGDAFITGNREEYETVELTDQSDLSEFHAATIGIFQCWETDMWEISEWPDVVKSVVQVNTPEELIKRIVGHIDGQWSLSFLIGKYILSGILYCPDSPNGQRLTMQPVSVPF